MSSSYASFYFNLLSIRKSVQGILFKISTLGSIFNFSLAKNILFLISNLEPLKLELGKEYNLNNMKEIEVTKDFLSLDESVIGCQNEGSIDDCETRKYVDVLLSQCII